MVHDATVDPPAFSGSLDADATLGEMQLPIIPGYGQAVTVKITPYPGFASGSVSGTAGQATNSLTSRNFGNFNDVTMPVTQEQTSQTPTTGTLTLLITDPQLRVTKVEFATQQSSGAWSSWVQDSVLPYSTSVAIAAGNQSKIGYRITGFDATGTLNVLLQSEVLFTSTTLGVPQPPHLEITRSTTVPTINNETVTVTGGLGANGVGPFQWRFRTHADFAAPPAWPAFSATPALPVDLTVTRGLKWQKILDIQVTDASGAIIEQSYTIQSKMQAMDDNGVVDDTIPMHRGANPFGRALDTAVDVISTSSRGFIDQAGLDLSLRPISVYRGSGYQATTGLFLRGTDLASDVVITSTRTFVDPNAATQVDASGRIVGVYRLGVYEPVNNLMKLGDALGNASASTLVVNSGAVRVDRNSQILSTIGGNTLLWGHANSDYWNAIGAQNSSGFPYIAFAAFQAAGDTWKRSGSTTYPAALMYSSTTGLFGLYNNSALGTADATVAFGPLWTVDRNGVMNVSSNVIAVGAVFGNAFFSARTAGVEKAYYGVSQATDNLVTGSVTGDGCLRLVTSGSRFLFSVDNGVASVVSIGSYGLRTAKYIYLDQAYESGLVGAYDPTKVRMIYAIGDPYRMVAGGTTLAGTGPGGSTFFGLFYGYDATATYINHTGHDLGHGVGVASNGIIQSYMGAGIWTASGNNMWVGTTVVAKVMWGGGAPSGAPSGGIGTIYFQTS